MAKNARNIVTQGLSGKLGDLIVFRQLNDETIVSAKPKKRVAPPGQGEIDRRKHFQEAILYAKEAYSEPALKEEYKQKAKGKGMSGFNIAVADFMNAPHIDEIDVSNYHGQVGDTIRIRVTDNFKVDSVHTTIRKGDGTEVEEGQAEVLPNGLDWEYKVTQANTFSTGCMFIVHAFDIPGNDTELNHSN